jgi:hypothetical protein
VQKKNFAKHREDFTSAIAMCTHKINLAGIDESGGDVHQYTGNGYVINCKGIAEKIANQAGNIIDNNRVGI